MLYNATYEDLEKELLELRELLVRTKNSTEKTLCLSSINALNLICNSFNDKYQNYTYNVIKNNRNKYYDSIKIVNKYNDMYMNNFIKNKEFYRLLFSRLVNVYRKEFNKLEGTNSLEEAIFSQNSANILLHNFFEEYHPKSISYIDELINNKRLMKCDELEGDYAALCFSIYKKQPLILVENSTYSINTITSLIHELGHAVDLKNVSDNYSINQYEKYHYQSDYIEFLSRLYERQALDYFYNLNINNDRVKELIDDYNYTNYINTLTCYVFTLLPDDLLEKSKYLKYDNEYVKMLIPVNEYDDDIDFILTTNDIDLRESMKYSISSLFATIVNNLLKNDQDRGKLVYEYIMQNRLGLFRPDTFDELDMSGQEIAKCLKKEINI